MYRARLVDDVGKLSYEGNTILGLDKYDSKEPPLNTSSAGRSNIPGETYLYLAGDKYTSCAEIKPLRGDYISIAKFQAMKDLSVFDLHGDMIQSEFKEFYKEHQCNPKLLLLLLMKSFYSSARKDDDYQVSQYIADWVRKHGYDGMCHRSFISDGLVYTIFNSSEDHICFLSSDIAVVGDTSIHAWTLNDESLLSSPKPVKTNFNKQIKENLLFELKYLNNQRKEKKQRKIAARRRARNQHV